MSDPKQELQPLWKENKIVPLEKEDKNPAPRCPFCQRKMVMQKYADDTTGYSCKICMDNGEHKTVITELL